jgi:glutathione S-transferase
VLSKADVNTSSVTSQNEQTTLLGGNKKEYAEIMKWMSFFNTEIAIPMTQMLLPQFGIIPYDKDQVELFTNMTQRSVDVVESIFKTANSWLVSSYHLPICFVPEKSLSASNFSTAKLGGNEILM